MSTTNTSLQTTGENLFHLQTTYLFNSLHCYVNHCFANIGALLCLRAISYRAASAESNLRDWKMKLNSNAKRSGITEAKQLALFA
jgi:hypothetical protein